MMDEKDKSVERLFDEYADGLQPRPDLARKAREKMHSRSHEGNARKKNIAIVFASLAGAAASVAVAVLSVNALIRVGGDEGSPATPPPPAVNATEYDITGVRAVAISRSTAAEYFDLSTVKAQYDIFAESYYACYLKDGGELVYVRGTFGIQTECGTTQVRIIAENAEYRRTDLEQSFKYIIGNGGEPITAKNYIDGEYISQTYFGTATTHYYVTTIGNDQAAYSVATDILPKSK